MTGPLVPLVELPGDGPLREIFDGVAAPRGGVVGNVFRALANAPETLRSVAALGSQVRFGTSLADLDRELVVLTVARATGCTYEWTHHLSGLIAGGMDPVDVVGQLDTPDGEVTAAVLRVARAVAVGTDATEGDCRRLRDLAGEAAVVETIVTAGYYVLLARVIQSLKVPLEDGTEPLSPPDPEERP